MSLSEAPTQPAPPPLAHAARPAISWRSVTLGLLGVAFINLLTPYNDNVLWNTFLVGNSLPLAAITLTFLLAILINGPLSVWAPRHALNRGELGIIMAMMLIGSSIPGSALMRYWPGSLVYPFYNAISSADAADLLERLNLPQWLYPAFSGSTPAEWGNDPITIGFVTRWSGDGDPPYGAWIRPALTWGVFFAAFHGAILCMLTLVRRQWYENERLAFPIAQIQLSLLEPPRAGRWLGGVLASRSFWIVFLGVNVLHTINALNVYLPKHFPEIPLRYDFYALFSERPWTYLPYYVKSAQIYFTAVGVAYLLPGAVSFSLWFMVLALAIWGMGLGMIGEPGMPGLPDQHFGGLIAYAVIVIWIGRKHWMVILRQALRGEREGEPKGRYLPYRWAVYGFLLCAAVMVGWMILAGMTPGAAVTVTVLLLLAFFLLARIVAETGLLHPGQSLNIVRPWQVLASYGHGHVVPVQSFWLASHLYLVHYDGRESFGVFASHAMKITDETVFDGRTLERQQQADRATGRKFIVLIGVTLVVAFVLSLASMLWSEYQYAYELLLTNPQPVNRHVGTAAPNGMLVHPTVQYDRLNYNYNYDPATHLTAGAATTVALSALRLRFTWWPIHPIGYLFMNTWPMHMLWYSVMFGWLARTLVLRFGGAKLYLGVQKAMMGLIIGEAFASFVWLIIGIAFSTAGLDYHPIRFTLH